MMKKPQKQSFPPIGVGFWKGAGIPQGKRVKTFVHCGSCVAYHRTDFWGDCREDSERFRFDELPKNAILVEDDEEEKSE